MNRIRRFPLLLVVAALASVTSACTSTFNTIGAGLAYERTDIPADRALLDLAYRSEANAHPNKHRLDLYLPADTHEPWPTLIFIHGGGWTHGDRAMGSLGIDPMRNIGRFYAARGMGAAILSYRLQPEVTWRDQIRDVADATAWVQREIGRYGGDPDALYVSGHSAGAWLAAWTGLSDAPLAPHDLDRSKICGLILVSGAGYDLADEETYALGASRRYFEKRFGQEGGAWDREASIYANLDSPAPPALVLSAEGEPVTFRRQGDRLFSALDERGRGDLSRRIEIPGQNHQRIIVGMSIDGDPVSESVLDFLSKTECPANRS